MTSARPIIQIGLACSSAGAISAIDALRALIMHLPLPVERWQRLFDHFLGDEPWIVGEISRADLLAGNATLLLKPNAALDRMIAEVRAVSHDAVLLADLLARCDRNPPAAGGHEPELSRAATDPGAEFEWPGSLRPDAPAPPAPAQCDDPGAAADPAPVTEGAA
jgi:hypothetical protein